MATEKVKLTKSALQKFIIWSTSRYNDYLGLGTKKEAVDRVYNSMVLGYDDKWKTNKDTVYKVECAAGNGEGYGNRYWRLKGRAGDYQYEVDCINKTVKGLQSGKILQFI